MGRRGPRWRLTANRLDNSSVQSQTDPLPSGRAPSAMSNIAGLLRGAVMRVQSTYGVTGPFGGERLVKSPGLACRGSRSLASPRAARRVVRAPGRSRASGLVIARSTGRSNTQMEPSRPTVPVRSCRRGARLIWRPITSIPRSGPNEEFAAILRDSAIIITRDEETRRNRRPLV